jgi:hypothetical protein
MMHINRAKGGKARDGLGHMLDYIPPPSSKPTSPPKNPLPKSPFDIPASLPKEIACQDAIASAIGGSTMKGIW